MSTGTLWEKSARGKVEIFRKSHGPSVMLKSASTLVMSTDRELLFSQEWWAPLGGSFRRNQLCWDLLHVKRDTFY